MKNENLVTAAVREPTARITRAAARQSSGEMLILDGSKQQDHKRVLRKNSKRAALDDRNSGAPVTACFQHKRRAVLKDVTNVCCDNSYRNCLNAAKIPVCTILYLTLYFVFVRNVVVEAMCTSILLKYILLNFKCLISSSVGTLSFTCIRYDPKAICFVELNQKISVDTGFGSGA